MNKKSGWRITKLLLCICMMVLLFPTYSVAAPEQNTKLTIQHLNPDVDFTFYKVADFSEHGKYELLGEFAEKKAMIKNLETIETSPQDMTVELWAELADTLDVFVLHEKVSYNFIERTDANGKVVLEGIEKGLYLIQSERVEVDGKMCTPKPMLVTLPTRDVKGEWTNQLELDYASKLVPDAEYDEYSVVKIWDDQGNENKRPPEGIKVTLYQDNEVYSEIVLNADNNWQYTWTKLPAGKTWKVIESEIPKGYRMASYQEGNVHVIENIYPTTPPNTPPNTPGNRIPKTGQLWWPVPILALLGIAFFTIGWTRRNSGRR